MLLHKELSDALTVFCLPCVDKELLHALTVFCLPCVDKELSHALTVFCLLCVDRLRNTARAMLDLIQKNGDSDEYTTQITSKVIQLSSEYKHSKYSGPVVQ